MTSEEIARRAQPIVDRLADDGLDADERVKVLIGCLSLEARKTLMLGGSLSPLVSLVTGMIRGLEQANRGQRNN